MSDATERGYYEDFIRYQRASRLESLEAALRETSLHLAWLIANDGECLADHARRKAMCVRAVLEADAALGVQS